jgi:hypothetical protein
MSLPLPYSASRLMPLPNEDAGYSNTGLRHLQEILLFDVCPLIGAITFPGYAGCACACGGVANIIPIRPISQMNPTSSRATAMIAM